MYASKNLARHRHSHDRHEKDCSKARLKNHQKLCIAICDVEIAKTIQQANNNNKQQTSKISCITPTYDTFELQPEIESIEQGDQRHVVEQPHNEARVHAVKLLQDRAGRRLVHGELGDERRNRRHELNRTRRRANDGHVLVALQREYTRITLRKK